MVTRLDELRFLKVKVEKHPTKEQMLEFLDKPDAIASLILNSDESKAMLVKQYRPGTQGELFEIPAGIIEKGESAISTLYREIREETGYEKEDYTLLYAPETPLVLSPGYTTEKLYVYIVKLNSDDIAQRELILDSGEDLTTHWVDLKDIFNITTDFKTHFALLLYKNLK